jgi:hypothetical protein
MEGRLGEERQAHLPVAESPGFAVPPSHMGPEGGLYLSAGLHGDEIGAVEGLYTWAALEGPRLRALPVIIFLCLNPHGLGGRAPEGWARGSS